MAGRKSRRTIDGVILLDKPVSVSSQQAVSRVRGLFNAAKAGHTGTLDPAASGLLPVCLGEATKFTQMLLDADKSYVARVVMGVTTDTGDAEGQVISRKPVSADRALVEATTARFVGAIQQMPPMYSALKHQGKPLYEYARAGIEIPREVRSIKIYELQVIDFKENYFEIHVRCSKGTYIRTLAMDIGEALGCGASLAALQRTAVGEFTLQDERVQTVAALENLDPAARDATLLPVDILARSLPSLMLDINQARRILEGQRLSAGSAPSPGLARIYDPEQRFLGLAMVDVAGRVAPYRLRASGVNDAPQNS